MALVMPNVGEAVLLQNLLNKTAPQDQLVKLFVNDVTPAKGDTAATYTEASGHGYAAKALAGADWTVTPGAPTVAAAPEQEWTFTGALGLVYGYMVVQAGSGILLWAERFTSAFTVTVNGDQIKVTPQFTAQ
jgi:hypothetical protein